VNTSFYTGDAHWVCRSLVESQPGVLNPVTFHWVSRPQPGGVSAWWSLTISLMDSLVEPQPAGLNLVTFHWVSRTQPGGVPLCVSVRTHPTALPDARSVAGISVKDSAAARGSQAADVAAMSSP
jgi:hypothetical protein